jgi:hypothetical protein
VNGDNVNPGKVRKWGKLQIPSANIQGNSNNQASMKGVDEA